MKSSATIFKSICFLSLTFAIAIYFSLFLSIFYYFNIETLIDTAISKRVLYSIQLSIKCAFIASFFSIAIAIPSGYALSRYNFFGKKLFDTLLEFPLVVSPSALGALILIFFSNPMGIWIQERFINFVYDANGIVLAQIVTTLGLTIRFVKNAFDNVPKKYEDVAKSYGVSPLTAFFKIVLPNSKSGIFYAFILALAKSIGEFGATITVAGTMQFKTETMPISVFMRLSSADLNGAVVMIFILIIISFLILYLLRLINRNISYA